MACKIESFELWVIQAGGELKTTSIMSAVKMSDGQVRVFLQPLTEFIGVVTP